MFEFLKWQARDVMSDPVSVDAGTTLADVEKLLEGHGFNSVPVVDGSGMLIGLVSSLDLLKAFAFDDESILPPYDSIMRVTVARVMTLEPSTVMPRTPLTRVLEKMVDTRNRSFPVIDDNRLVGVVSRRDVMAALRRADAGESSPTPAD